MGVEWHGDHLGRQWLRTEYVKWVRVETGRKRERGGGAEFPWRGVVSEKMCAAAEI
jgi:hypothetical protein